MRIGPDFEKIREVHSRIEQIREKVGERAEQKKRSFIEVMRDLEGDKGYVDKISFQNVEDLIEDVSRKFKVDSALIRAVIEMESGGNAKAVSFKGAMGLMQLMPATAKDMGVEDPFDPRQNVEGGVRYLAHLLRKYDGDLDMALAAYNAGPGRVDYYRGIPPFGETVNFVRNVKALYEKFKRDDS